MLPSLALFCSIALQDPKIEFDKVQLEKLAKFTKDSEKLAKEQYVNTADVLGIPRSSLADVKIIIDFNYDGVAATSGKTIRVSAKYAAAHPDDIGCVYHELCHAAQGYPKYDPVWLVEGIADYARWFVFEPTSKRPVVKKSRANARASYRTTGAFLDWVLRTKDKEIVHQMNKALRDDVYKEELWKEYTGSTLDELNEQWKATLSD